MMPIQNKLRKNVLILSSLVFSAIPLILFLWELLISSLLPKGSYWHEKLFIYPFPWAICLALLWIAMILLISAVIYRRVKHDKQYPFIGVFLLFSVQAFVVFNPKFAMPPILLFIIF